MSTTQDGGSAFPEVFTDQPSSRNMNEHPDVYSAGGMTLRDWFAGQAQGFAPDTTITAALESLGWPHPGQETHAWWLMANAAMKWKQADALLLQRTKSQ